MPTFAEWDAARKARQGTPETVSGGSDTGGGSSSILPSGAAGLGSLLGLAAPELTLPGAAIGSSAKELAGSLPKLLKMGIGPMSTEGVGQAMLEPAERIAGDVAKTGILNKVPAALGWMGKTVGPALTKFGESAAGRAPLWQRGLAGAVADPILKMLGLPSGVAEVASVVAPPAARVAGPAITAAGEAMPSSVITGLRSAGSALKPGLPEPEPVIPDATDADVMREAVSTARGYKNAGMSHAQASQRAGLPKAGPAALSATDMPYGPDQGPPLGSPKNPRIAEPSSLSALKQLTAGEAATGYHAADVLAQPGSQEYMDRQFSQNHDLARQVLGSQVDPSTSPTDLPSGDINLDVHDSAAQRLADLSKQRAVGQAFRTKTPLAPEQ